MKNRIKYIGSFLMAIVSLALGAQTTTENHVVSKTYKVKSQTSLNTQNPDSIVTSIQYFDGLGRAKQSVLVKGGSASYANNTVPYDWELGNSNQSSFYNIYGSVAENQVINGTTPFGDTDLLWECVNDASTGADGGWTTDYIPVDISKPYRYSMWIKRSGNRTDGTIYFGGGSFKNMDGSANANPYFWIGDLPQIDTWYLLVGYVHPSDYTGADIGVSGIYDTSGNKVLDGTEYRWNGPISDIRFNNYLVSATDANTRQYFWSPLVQQINGSEDSLNDIVNNTSIYNNQVIQAKDIVTHVEYDGFGRQAKEYLPYASTSSDGSFNALAKENTQNYYLNKYANDFSGITDPTDVNSFSEKIFESSVLSRPVEQTAPGLAWKQSETLVSGKEYSDGNTIKLEYDLNAVNEVKYFPVTISVSGDTYTPLLGTSSYYSAGELTKSITKDENWTVADGLNKTTEEFKDKNGQVVLKRTYNAGQSHDTYYIYDDYGNLSFVLPPKASDQTITQTVLDELCYQYTYDYRGRLVEKKIPGKGWEYIVYDKLDRPVLTQDALQRASDKWLFTKYDALGRVTYTGEYVSNNSRSNIQNTVNSQSAGNLYEDKVTIAPSSLGGEDVYYTYRSFPNTTNVTVYTVNYYDTYLDLPSGFVAPTSVYDTDVTASTQSLATISKVRVLGTNDWITTVTYYDDKARPIYIYSQNDYLQTTDIVESKLDFTGKVLETKTTHKKTGQNDVITVDTFEYDHMDRLLSQTQKVNDFVAERIVKNNYDDLGQLESKLTGDGTQKGYTDVTSGITVSQDVITKTSATGWNEGLATLGKFQANGYIEFYANQLDKRFMVGLSTTNANASYTAIDYALYIRDGEYRVYESNVFIGNYGQFDVGDHFSVERVGSQVFYKRNGETFYISQTASNGELLGDISIDTNNSQIKNLHIVDNSKGLQNVDYNYNVRGWLKNINEDAQNDNDLFNFTLRYNDPTSGTALFNGNISQTSWNTANTDNSVKTYTYTYDALNRITSGIDNTGNYNLTSVSYDKNGNILNLQRQGHTNVGATLFGLMDDLSYTYDSGNKLVQVDEAAENSTGFKDVTGVDFTYDVNGNMITDGNKGILSIQYNHLNLPTKVFMNSGRYIDYKYDAAGMKLEKIVTDNGTITTTDYAGNYIYENGVLQFFSNVEGYVKHDQSKFENVYQYKDHLGNVRLSYSDVDSDGTIDTATEIIEESNYYPFGSKHKGYNNVVSPNGNSVAQKDKTFQGQKLDDELGLNWTSFKWRNYDASLARFHNIDPLAQEYAYQSPYNFSENRVIDGVELEGLEFVSAKKARLEIGTRGFLAGKVLIKTQNMSTVFRNAFNKANNDPSKWPSGQVGVSREIGEAKSIARRPTTRGVLNSSIKIERDIPLTKDGKPDKRYNRDRFGSVVGISPNGKQVSSSRAMAIFAALDLGFQINDAVASTKDYFGISRDFDLIKQSEENLLNYMSEGLLADKFNNTEDLARILNVIFQGDAGHGGTMEHVIIGLTIYNRYNDDKQSRGQLEFYQTIYRQLQSLTNEDGTLKRKGE